MLQLEVLIANFGITNSVVASRTIVFSVDGTKLVITELVHKTIQHSRRAALINTEFAVLRVIVLFMDVWSFGSRAADTDLETFVIKVGCINMLTCHPQELVDIVWRVASKTAENYENIINVQLLNDFVGVIFGRCHRLSDSRYVCVVLKNDCLNFDSKIYPSVVVDNNGSIGHCRKLISKNWMLKVRKSCNWPIIPPAHDFGVFVGVLSQPVVGLTEVVKDDAVSMSSTCGQNNWRTARIEQRLQTLWMTTDLYASLVTHTQCCTYETQNNATTPITMWPISDLKG